MRNHWTALLFGWGVLLGAIPASGAGGDLRADVTGAAGAGTWGGMGHNTTMGSGLSAGGSVGYRLTRRFWLEAEYDIFRMNGHDTHYVYDTTNPAPGTVVKASGTFETPYKARGSQTSINCLWQASEGRARTYFLLGAAVQTFRQEEPVPYSQYTRVGPALNLGVGAKIRLTQHLLLRPEGRVHIGGNTSGMTDMPFAQARFTLGLGYAW